MVGYTDDVRLLGALLGVAAMGPAIKGRIHMPNLFAVSVFCPPQWSRPLRTGSTSCRCRGVILIKEAVMEPAA
jgi:hypothetical protein